MATIKANSVKALVLATKASFIKSEKDIYFMDVDFMMHEGDEQVSAIPWGDENGLIGLCIEHSYWDEEMEQYQTWNELVRCSFPRLHAAA